MHEPSLDEKVFLVVVGALLFLAMFWVKM